MTDLALANSIERWLADDPVHMGLHSLSEAQWRGIIAALRRGPDLKAAYFEGYEDALKDRKEPERPPSGEMVAEFMPCEAQPNPEPKMVVPIATLDRIMRDCEHGSRIWKECDALLRAYRLAAAEAEGRKS